MKSFALSHQYATDPIMSTKTLKPKDGILKISPYIPGKSDGSGHKPTYKLSANESALGASEKALEAIIELASKSHLYPDGSCEQLRQGLADKYMLNKDQFVVGAGSDEILHLLAQTYVGEADETIVTQYGFLVYPIVTLGAGGTPKVVPEKHYHADVDIILAAVTSRTKIVFLANPNNPTGTYIPFCEVTRLADNLPPHILLVLDGAYAHYVTAQDYQDGLSLATSRPNVVVVQTFSKIGLANLRVGWMYGAPDIIDAMNRLRGPFNVNGFAQAAALATLKDTDFAARLKQHNTQWRQWAIQRLDTVKGLHVLPSEANFVQILFDDAKEKSALAADRYLSSNGFIVRTMQAYGIPNGLRITIGAQDAFEGAIKALEKFMAG